MHQTIFFSLFSIILISLNIYCFIKKKYLYLFVTCMLFLPDYYGIEFSASLPVLTVERMMYIIFFFYTFLNRKRNLIIKEIKIRDIPKEYFFLFGYFALRMISNLYYAFSYFQSVKSIFIIIFEQLFFLICIYILAPGRKEITALINVIVYTSAAFYFIGILESLLKIQPFSALYTVSRYMLNDYYIRLGLLRSTTTFGLANGFGNMCILTFPLILYMYSKSHQSRYIFFSVLNFMAIIHSGCRSDIFFFLIVTLVYFFTLCLGNRRKKEFIKHLCLAAAAILVVITILSSINPTYKYFYQGTAKSLLNEVGFDFDLNEGKPDGVEGYGSNAVSGKYSRFVQFTCVIHAMRVNPLFGQGTGAELRDEVKILSKNKWQNFYSFDVGYVSMLVTEGIIGFLGFISLIFYLIMKSTKRHLSVYDKRFFLLLIFTYLLCLLSTSITYDYLLLYIVIISTLSTTKEKTFH